MVIITYLIRKTIEETIIIWEINISILLQLIKNSIIPRNKQQKLKITETLLTKAHIKARIISDEVALIIFDYGIKHITEFLRMSD